MSKISGKRMRIKTFYQTELAETVTLAVRRITTRSGRTHPPYLEVKVPRRDLGKRSAIRWNHSLRDCGDDLVALLATLLGYDIGTYEYSGLESIGGVDVRKSVILFFGDGAFTCALSREAASGLLDALSRLFAWDLTGEEPLDEPRSVATLTRESSGRQRRARS